MRDKLLSDNNWNEADSERAQAALRALNRVYIAYTEAIDDGFKEDVAKTFRAKADEIEHQQEMMA